jgi:cytochrome c553
MEGLMRFILILLFIVIFSGCENKTTNFKDAPNTQAENEKAKIIFQRCQRCHGMKGEKSALNVSDVIAYYSKNDLIKALTLYKKRERDRHRFGSLMTGILRDLSNEDIKILADYISNFKEKN